MQLYFSPMACSMATRISLYETGTDAVYVEVDPETKLTMDGRDFRAVNPLGLVPTIQTDDGEVLTENAAILQYVAERFPGADLAPAGGLERARLQQWLCFIGTELHKGLFAPLLDAKAPAEVKRYALGKAAPRLDMVARHLADRAYLLDRFSVADAYLFTVLCWLVVTPLRLGDWPALAAYCARLSQRPAVARALHEERALYVAELSRHAAQAKPATSTAVP
jgi:glutathione S-transferase